MLSVVQSQYDEVCQADDAVAVYVGVGVGEVEVPVWLRSWWNIGHQSTLSALAG